MSMLRAEIISIGDEMTSGQRLDTNTQWLSQQLGESGVHTAFHTTVADHLADNISVFKTAIERADVVICTGGLGPTKDDLTRQAIAAATGRELEFHPAVVEHIRVLFENHGRTMPDNNLVQAYFPMGSNIIGNPEGTAPGIDMAVDRDGVTCRVFALPGVPAEMKQMWAQEVGAAIREMTGETRTTHHHVLHCIGAGESQIEEMLPDMINRSRVPRVGITASHAIISLRISATAISEEECVSQIQPTIETIRQTLGTMVFGENDDELSHVVVNLLRQNKQKLSVIDFGLCGAVSHTLGQVDRHGRAFAGGTQLTKREIASWLGANHSSTTAELTKLCSQKIREQIPSDIGVAIGPLEHAEKSDVREFQLAISSGDHVRTCTLNYGGHSAIRDVRSQKHVLNQIRLALLTPENQT